MLLRYYPWQQMHKSSHLLSPQSCQAQCNCRTNTESAGDLALLQVDTLAGLSVLELSLLIGAQKLEDQGQCSFNFEVRDRLTTVYDILVAQCSASSSMLSLVAQPCGPRTVFMAACDHCSMAWYHTPAERTLQTVSSMSCCSVASVAVDVVCGVALAAGCQAACGCLASPILCLPQMIFDEFSKVKQDHMSHLWRKQAAWRAFRDLINLGLIQYTGGRLVQLLPV
eukprot:jgi/Chrzof1/12099/Cz06g21100.t1